LDAEEQDDVDEERQQGEQAEQAVDRDHEHRDEGRTDDAGDLAGGDRIGAEARADGALLHNVELGRQRAGAEQDREIVRLLDGEAALDVARPAGDRRADAGGGDDLVVEHDGERPPHVLRRRLAEALGAADVEAEVDDRLVSLLVEGGLGVGEVRAVHDDAPLDRDALAVGVARGQEVDVRRPGLGGHAELELCRPAQDLLEPLGILKARHLDEDAAESLALDRRLRGAEGVDAAADHLDRLLGRPSGALRDALIREGELDQAVRLLDDVEVAVAGLAEHGVGDRLRQLAQLREEPLPLGGLRDAELHAARQGLDAALEGYAGLAEDAPHVVAKLDVHRAKEVALVDLQQHVRSALEVEAEGDALRRHHPGRDPARNRRPEGDALGGAEQVRRGEQAAVEDDRDDG
jgi:hypothetical protein